MRQLDEQLVHYHKPATLKPWKHAASITLSIAACKSCVFCNCDSHGTTLFNVKYCVGPAKAYLKTCYPETRGHSQPPSHKHCLVPSNKVHTYQPTPPGILRHGHYIVQWLKKLSQCFTVFARLTWAQNEYIT